ncbi:transposase [Actinomycetota bacterium]|nr:transposase [Actinomycetota bacterium]
MQIEQTINHGKAYLRLAYGIGDIVDGVRQSKKVVLKNLGPLSRFDDGKPNYLERLRASYRAGDPLIDILNDYPYVAPKKRGRPRNNTFCDSYIIPKNIGYFFLDSVFDKLGIYDVLNEHKSKNKLGYDIIGLTKLLVFGRVLDPQSKKFTFANHRDRYLFNVTKSDDINEVYNTLTQLDKLNEKIQKRMNYKVNKMIKRDTETVFYDVTNTFFETEYPDDFRKWGHSKENRRQPLVQLGLFMDNNGLPISFKTFPGNTQDKSTLRPALQEHINKYKLGKVIVVADRGLNTGVNNLALIDDKNGYIVSQSVKRCPKDMYKWITDDVDHSKQKYNFIVKSRKVEREYLDKDGKKRTTLEKQVCYWSRKFYNREMHENADFIEHLNNCIENPDKIKDKEPKLNKFLKEITVDPITGEKIKVKKIKEVDEAKAKRYIDSMGYYVIVTSETDRSSDWIMNKYHGLSQIEDNFRIMKSELDLRPVFVRTKEHIDAHMLLCFIGLLMIRLLQFCIKDKKGDTDGWTEGITARRLKEVLNNLFVDRQSNGQYKVTKPAEEIYQLLKSCDIEFDFELPYLPELQQLKYNIDRNLLCAN